MKLPIKCGNAYIKFDKNNQPEYGFEVDGKRIERFIPLSDKPITQIVLPQLAESKEFEVGDIDQRSVFASAAYMQKKKLKDYIKGSVKICNGCFNGIKNATIVIPFENSVMLDWGSFDRDAEIELVMPENLTLKQIYRTFDAGYDYERENWTVIADKKITGHLDFGDIGNDSYSIAEYDINDLRQTVANFILGESLKKEQTNEEADEAQLEIL